MEDQCKGFKQGLDGCFIYRHEKGDYRILPWEGSFALEQLNHGVWEEAKDHTRKYFDRRPLAGLHPTEINFLAKIPEEVKTICLRVEHCQYTCFKLLHDVPEAIGLAREVPALFWSLAVRVATEQTSPQKAVQLLKGKRSRIVLEICGRNTTWTVNFFKKVKFSSYSSAEAEAFQDLVMRLGRSREILHYPVLPVMGEACDRNMSSLQLPLLRHVLKRDGEDWFYMFWECLDDCRIMTRQLGRSDEETGLTACTGFERLLVIHNSLQEDFCQEEMLRSLSKTIDETSVHQGRQPGALPAPPLPGKGVISPVTTIEELFLEGRFMEHCVFSHLPYILCGESFIYRYRGRERGTLELGEDLRVLQFKLKRNAQPSQSSWDRVQAWLKDALAEKEPKP